MDPQGHSEPDRAGAQIILLGSMGCPGGWLGPTSLDPAALALKIGATLGIWLFPQCLHLSSGKIALVGGW